MAQSTEHSITIDVHTPRNIDSNPEYARALEDRAMYERTIQDLEHRIADKKQELLVMKFEKPSFLASEVQEVAESIVTLEKRLRRMRQRDLNEIATMFGLQSDPVFSIDRDSASSVSPGDESHVAQPKRSMVLQHWEKLVSSIRGIRKRATRNEPTGSAAAAEINAIKSVEQLTEKKYKVRAALLALKQKTHSDTDGAVTLLREKLRLIDNRISELTRGPDYMTSSAIAAAAASAGSDSGERLLEHSLSAPPPRIRERSMSTF